MSHKHPLLWFARAAGVCLVRPLLRKFTCIPLPFYIRQTAFFFSPTGNLLPVVAITICVSDSPLFPVAGKAGKRAVFDIRRKGNPKTIGFWQKLPKRRLLQIQQGSAPIFTPQRGWKSADTTVCASAYFLLLLAKSMPSETQKKNATHQRQNASQTHQKARFPHRKRALQQLLFSSWYGSPPGTWDR